MAVRKNIGKLIQALDAGEKALSLIDQGPKDPNSPLNKLEYNTLEYIPTNEAGIFVWGVHKWGDLHKVVG